MASEAEVPLKQTPGKGEGPSDKDVQLAHETANTLSSLIQTAFDVNHNIPPMPPWPAIPKSSLEGLIKDSEMLLHQAIVYAKQLKKHAELKELEAGPLVAGIASIEAPYPEMRISFPGETVTTRRRRPKIE